MIRLGTSDRDYLAARLHGRRSRMAEGDRLEPLCRLRSLHDLVHTFYPDADAQTAGQFQRHLVLDLALELRDLSGALAKDEARLVAWMLARFQVENLKVLVRGLVTQAPRAVIEQSIVPLPDSMELGAEVLAAASLEDLVARLPAGTLRESLRQAVKRNRDDPHPFFFEAALDCGYLRELIGRLNSLSAVDRETIAPMVHQEADIFHLQLVARGRFVYGLKPDLLLPLHVTGSGISHQRFADMLNAADLAAAMGRPTGPAPDAAAVEALAWNRYLLLANRAFRRGRMGFGVIVGYAGIRRAEVANLITLSEGIRAGMASEAIRTRMIPRIDLDLEVTHV